jgi:hypothetical protein
MSYRETQSGAAPIYFTTIEIKCDARRGKGICSNRAKVTMNDRDAAKKFLFALGWRLLRGHQVCLHCCSKKRITFPRISAIQEKP